MKRILFFFLMLATFASAQTDSTDILITIREDGDTTQVGKWRAGMPVLIRDSWDGWGAREKLPNKFVIIRSGISKTMIDSFLVAHYDSTTGLRRKYQLSRAAIQFVKNNRDENNIVRVTPTQLRNAFKRANRLRRFGEPQRMSVFNADLYARWRNMMIAATPTSATVDTDGGGDYTSLAAAEAGEQKDLVAANEQLTINCSGTTADVTAVTFSGWTTDAMRNIVVQGDNTSGIWDDGKYRLVISGLGSAGAIASEQPNTVIHFNNLQISFTSNASYAQGLRLRGSGSVYTVNNCIIKSTGGTSVNKSGIYFNAATAKIKNTICYDLNYGIACELFINAYLYSVNIYNAGIGIWRITSGNLIVKNTVVQNCADGFDGTFAAGSDYNISDLAGDAPGANSLNSTTVNFADAANGDFRLLAGSSGIDQGVDLSSDPNFPFNTDIIGTVRPQGAAWDVGAFEYVQPATTDKKSRYKGFGTGFKGGWKK